jgi:hypothetical protein
MTPKQGSAVSRLLETRSGLPSRVTLQDGKVLQVHNVAAGRDMGAEFDHFTTNISPAPSGAHTVDFFTADQVVEIVALESAEVLFAA